MREIEFRGKPSDGKWVYGYLTEQFVQDKENLYFITDVYGNRTAVVPWTIGQYSEINDNNGQKIYEGDIMQYGHKWNSPEEVQYGNGSFSGDDMTLSEIVYTFHGVTVIGNIYENKNLIQNGEK